MGNTNQGITQFFYPQTALTPLAQTLANFFSKKLLFVKKCFIIKKKVKEE